MEHTACFESRTGVSHPNLAVIRHTGFNCRHRAWSWGLKMQFDGDEQLDESGEGFTARIRTETREKILQKSKPIDLEALRKSMSLPEPSHLGNLGKIGKPAN